MKKHTSSIISNLFGKFAAKEFSKPIQKIINNVYVQTMGIDMSNFEASDSYRSLTELFTRSMKKEPIIDARKDSVISPCDAKIIDFGTIKNHTAYQIKGMEYNTNELIGAHNSESFSLLEGGEYINFYLSPKDYHRYHMPFDVRVLSVMHIPGKLYPVNMPLLKRKKNLYIENERVVLKVIDRFEHIHFIVLVGALNVGKMVVTFDKRIKTNSTIRKRIYHEYSKPIHLKKGELFGWFEMGSTIVILSQKESIEWSVSLNQKVSFGDVLGNLFEN